MNNDVQSSKYAVAWNLNTLKKWNKIARLSVLTPVYHAQESTFAKFIEQMKQISSMIPNMQLVIVVDDDDTDTMRMAEGLKQENPELDIKLVSHHGNKGIGPARNTCLDNADGEILWFADYDDIYHAGNVKALYNAMCSENSKNCNLAIGRLYVQYPNGKTKAKCGTRNYWMDYRNKVCSDIQWLKAHLTIPGISRFMIRKSFLDNSGLRFEQISPGEDKDFLYKAVMLEKKAFVIHNVIYTYC